MVLMPGGADSGVMARLRAASSLLGPSERRVAQVVLSRPAEVVDWSTTELALAADTSPATVIRACQSLGFRGFQHLRLEVARAAGEREHEGPDDLVGGVFSEAIDALRLGQESVDGVRVEEAAATLSGARRIVLLGNGFSGPPVQDAALRFSTLGRSIEAPVDILAQQFAVHSLSDQDVCLAVSYSGANAHTLTAARTAVALGARLIVVTSYARSPLARIATIALVTGPASRAHDVDPFLSRLGHLVVLHALHTALSARSGGGDTAHMRHVVADALAEDA